MDRAETIRISKLTAFGGLTESDISVLLMSYCLEHNKPEYETALFVTTVLSNLDIFGYCINIALDYYERKFNICKLWDKPLDEVQPRQLLQIF